MGFFKAYENKLFEIWECDTCNRHTIVRFKNEVDINIKKTDREMWIREKK